MENNEKKLWRSIECGDKEKQKKSYSNSKKKIRKESVIYFCKKSQNFGPHHLRLDPLSNFGLRTSQSWIFVTGIQSPSTLPWLISEFYLKILKMKSIKPRPVFSLLMYIVHTILVCIIKLRQKLTVFCQANFCERLMYLQCFHYRTTRHFNQR